MKVNDLFKAGKITVGHYKTYLLFEEYDEGRDWLKNMFDCTLAERVPPIGDHAYAVHYGRLSLLQDIKLMIDQVKQILENEDDSERKRTIDTRITTNRPLVGW